MLQEISFKRIVVSTISGVLPVTGERAVELFLPPEVIRTPPVAVLSEPAVVLPRRSLLVGVAVVDRAGRVRDRVLIMARGWTSGDCLHWDVRPTALVLTLSPHERHSIDGLDQVFISAGARAVFGIGIGIGAGDRVVLVAVPESGTLIVHPSSVIQDVLWDYYASLPGGLGAG